MEPIKGCPFCQCAASLTHYELYEPDEHPFHIETNCGARGPASKTSAEAIATWNTCVDNKKAHEKTWFEALGWVNCEVTERRRFESWWRSRNSSKSRESEE